MDSIDEAASTQTVSKRKRTKRQRLLLLGPAPTRSSSPATSSTDLSGGCTTEEEEDMANCLILLAQGRSLVSIPKPQEKFTSRRFTEAATTTSGKAGFYVYECKTCNKCFPSFQALGGHRASHKKPKIAIPAAAMSVDDYEKKVNVGHEQHGLDLSMNSSFSKGLMKAKVHECSICGSEFSSGQALGGHMRRHRPASISDVSPEVKKERNILSLDLNLPAPCDDAGDMSPAAFAFSGKAMVVFSGPAMVDCHY